MTAEEVDRVPVTEEDREKLLGLLMEQARELAAQGALDARVTCPCGRVTPLWRGARCLFCGVFLCAACGARHFGGNGEAGPVLSALGRRLKVLGEDLFLVDVQPFPESGEPGARLLVCMPFPDPTPEPAP